jgi:hypothetical protein
LKRKALRFGRGFRVAIGNRRSQAAGMVLAPGKPGSPMPIERGDEHRILNNGRTMLRTLDFHVPPAHDEDGDELPRGKR